MDNTDVLFGRGNDDLLVGNLGGDTLLGGRGSDILIGGPENFTGAEQRRARRRQGNDINIWAPGDGSDAFVGNEGYDTMVFAPFVKKADGSLEARVAPRPQGPARRHRRAAAVQLHIVKVPASEQLGFQFLVRFNVNGNPVVTVRQKDVEQVFCPSGEAGKAQVADLTSAHPTFRTVSLRHVHGVDRRDPRADRLRSAS